MIYDEFLYYLLPTIRKIVFLKTILRKWIIFRKIKIKNCFEKQEEILKIYFFSSRRRIILFFTIFFLHLPLKINFRAIKLFRQNGGGYENILKIISRKIKINSKNYVLLWIKIFCDNAYLNNMKLVKIVQNNLYKKIDIEAGSTSASGFL